MKIQPLTPVHNFAGFNFPRYIPQLPKGKPASRLPRKERVCGPYYVDPGVNPPGEFSFYLESDFQPFTRWQWCDEVGGVRINHTGWFTNEDQSDKMRGIVVRLPHNRGFLTGWSMGEGMSSCLDRSIYHDEYLAAYGADSFAQAAAEKERDYQEKWRAEQDAEDAKEAARKEADELRAEIDQLAIERLNIIAAVRGTRKATFRDPYTRWAVVDAMFDFLHELRTRAQRAARQLRECEKLAA